MNRGGPRAQHRREPAVTEPKLNVIEAQCVAKGMRMTEQRRVIARALAQSADHPDVEELYRRCEEIERLQADIARRLGYRLVDHRLELYAVPLADAKKR